MKFKLHYGHLFRFKPVLDAFKDGIIATGNEVVDDNEDVNVVWSSVWDGMEQENRKIYENSRENNKPVIFIDHGNLLRGKTFLVGINNTNNLGIFGNKKDLDPNRPEKLGISLSNTPDIRRSEILLVCQPERSLTWQGQPSTYSWIKQTVLKINTLTQRRITLIVHPQASFPDEITNGTVVLPKHMMYGHDDVPLDYNYHCVIDFSGPSAMKAAIAGIPIICDSTSLAAELSNVFEDIENPVLPDRKDWLIKVSHTEWTVGELSDGTALRRLIDYL